MWYRVADLRPELRSHLKVHRHVYRGQVWFVVQDPANGRSHRFSPLAQHLVGLMDGQRTVHQIWEFLGKTLADNVPTQDETIQLLAQLHLADALRSDASPDADELFARFEKREQARRRGLHGNPLSLRFPLFDPDTFLTRTLRFVRPLFGLPGAVVWVATVVAGVILAGTHWSELTENFSDRLLTAQNLLLVWITYPIVKALHELGHAYAVRIRGGEVREIGVMLLVLMPVPYVDASGASAFPDKRHRMLVGAAGVAVEVFLAALAMLVWAAVEPGLLRAAAYNVLVIGGASTLLFNANPLLRFDGYYVLADAIEIPNLAARASQFMRYLARRYLFGISEARSPVQARGEQPWLFGYAILSLLYRTAMTLGILMFVAEKLWLAGVLLAGWILLGQVRKPLAGAVGALLRDPEIASRRTRVLGVTGGLIAALVLGLCIVPVPLTTTAQGVMWLPPQAEVHAGADGTIVRLLATPGATVAPGEPLLETIDPYMPARVAAAEAKLREVEARYQAAVATDASDASKLEGDLDAAAAAVADARQREGQLTLRSPVSGVFVIANPEDLPGRFVRRGDLVAYVADMARGTGIVAVGQADIGLIRAHTERVRVRLSDALDEIFDARITRAVPAGSDRLPSPALGSAGGGPFAVAPDDQHGTRSLEKVFHIELALSKPLSRLGGRAYVRFEHGMEPLVRQWYRRIRQLFLSRFDV